MIQLTLDAIKHFNLMLSVSCVSRAALTVYPWLVTQLKVTQLIVSNLKSMHGRDFF